MAERTYQCRRSKACRAWLPDSSFEWQEEAGQRRPFCLPGMCPNGKRSDTSDELLALQLELRKVKEAARTAERDRDRAVADIDGLEEFVQSSFAKYEVQQPRDVDCHELMWPIYDEVLLPIANGGKL